MKCKAIKETGEQCNANAMKGGYCFLHNPDTEAERLLAQQKGGTNRLTIQKYGEAVRLETVEDVKGLMNMLINGIIEGTVPTNNPAGQIGFLTRIWLDAYERADIEKEITEIELRLDKAGI
jgi:hypothetical protein